MSLSREELGKIQHFPFENVESDTEIYSWCFALNEEVCTVNALFDVFFCPCCSLSAQKHVLDNIKPQGDRFVFPDIHRVVVLASGRVLNWGANGILPSGAGAA